MKLRFADILLCVGLAGSCACVHALDWGDHAKMPVPDGAKVTLVQHADELRKGKKFKPSDPEITPVLFGRAPI